MPHHTRPRGFTLIELLVVIAIIGILSAIVMASLNAARTKGSDAGLRANLKTVQTQAALFSSDNNSYGTFDDGAGGPTTCPLPTDVGTTLFHNTTVANAIAAALLDSMSGTAVCIAADDSFAVAVARPNDGNAVPPSTYWCVDSAHNNCGVNSNALTGASCGTCDTTD